MAMNADKFFKYSRLEPQLYFLILIISTIVLGVIMPTVLIIAMPRLFTGIIGILLYPICFGFVFLIAMIPLLERAQRKAKIDRVMPLFVTEMAALSTADMPFDKVFYLLSEKIDYGPLADDARKIFRLIKHYHLSGSDSLRFVASRTPSVMESDFLNRLAHSQDIGEQLVRFMKNEHEVFMDEHVLKSESGLKDLDFIKELFTGIVTSLIFVTVMICITPLLGIKSMDQLLYGVVLAFAGMEVVFVYYIKTKMPKEDIWIKWREKVMRGLLKHHDKTLIAATALCITGTVGLAIALIPMHLPFVIYVPAMATPMLIPGVLVMREETRIQKRDAIFGAFIRALGRSCSVSGQTMVDSVKKLSIHRFGPLTDMVRNLSHRLQMHIDPIVSWRHFGAETNSNIINRFSDLYVKCTSSGANAAETANFISNQEFRMLAIRKKRAVLTSSFFGILYGVMISLAFTMWLTLGIVEYMIKTINQVSTDATSTGFVHTIFSTDVDLGAISTCIILIVFIHSVASALLIPVLRGGNMASATTHFVILIWIGCGTQAVVQSVLSGLLV
jgi:flagellar protein FlaJ